MFTAIYGGCTHDDPIPSRFSTDFLLLRLEIEGCASSKKKRHESKSFVARNESYHLFLDVPWLIARNRIESDRYCGPLYIQPQMTMNYLRQCYLRVTESRGKGETPRDSKQIDIVPAIINKYFFFSRRRGIKGILFYSVTHPLRCSRARE